MRNLLISCALLLCMAAGGCNGTKEAPAESQASVERRGDGGGMEEAHRDAVGDRGGAGD